MYISCSERTARRHAQSMNLTAGKTYKESSLEEIIVAVQNELDGVAKNMGATAIWSKMKHSSQILAKRLNIMLLTVIRVDGTLTSTLACIFEDVDCNLINVTGCKNIICVLTTSASNSNW